MDMAFATGLRGTSGPGVRAVLATLAMEETGDPALVLCGMSEHRAKDEQGEGQEEAAREP